MKRYLNLFALAIAAMLVLAACGGDTEDTTTTEAAAETTTTEAMGETTTTEAMMESNTIADIVAGDENFSTLLAAVDAAGLVDALADPDATLTVFAPTNEAFEAALEALGLTAEELLASEDLSDILLYHVLGEVVTSADLVAADAAEIEVTTLQGSPLVVLVSDAGVGFSGSDAMVSTPDVEADNGVIHIIDGVLLPPAEG